MRQHWSETFKQVLRPAWYRLFAREREAFECPICGYQGPFKDKRISRKPDLVRRHSKCLACGSTERHRMLHLVLEELFATWSPQGKKLLHIAPEDCLKEPLQSHFGTYHTADLLRKNVDFQEDIQSLSFPDGSYDATLVSRVLTIPPDLDASIHELRRVLSPGGVAIVAEIYTHDQTLHFGEMRSGRSREIGVNFLELLQSHFDRVDVYLSDRYPSRFQLTNRMVLEGQPRDNYPDRVRVPHLGFMDLVAVCHR